MTQIDVSTTTYSVSTQQDNKFIIFFDKFTVLIWNDFIAGVWWCLQEVLKLNLLVKQIKSPVNFQCLRQPWYFYLMCFFALADVWYFLKEISCFCQWTLQLPRQTDLTDKLKSNLIIFPASFYFFAKKILFLFVQEVQNNIEDIMGGGVGYESKLRRYYWSQMVIIVIDIKCLLGWNVIDSQNVLTTIAFFSLNTFSFALCVNR